MSLEDTIMYKEQIKKRILSFPALLAALSIAMLAFITIGKAGAFPEPAKSQYTTISETAQERGYHVKGSKPAPSETNADYSYTLSKGIVPADSLTFTVSDHTVVSVSNHDQSENILLEDLFVEDDDIYLNAENLNKYFDLLDEEVERRSEFVVGPDETLRLLEQYCNTEDKLQYYAHLDYETAGKDIRRVILVARNQIIYRVPWCDDNVNSCVIGADGNVKETLPHFHELFPLDWEVPIHPVSVD